MKRNIVGKRLLVTALMASMAMTPVTAGIPVYAQNNTAAVSEDDELTPTGKESNAVIYANEKGIYIGAVLGGDGLILDEATNSIFESITITEW